MADLTEEEFLARAGLAGPRVTAEQISAAVEAAPPSPGDVAHVARLNQERLSRGGSGAPTLRQELGELSDAPLDIDSGMGAGTQFQVSRRRTEEDKLRYLAAQFGADKVRFNDRGDAIVRTSGADGKPRDILVNAKGLSTSDLGALVAHLPELVGAMAGPAVAGSLIKALMGVRAVKLGALANGFASAAGAEVGGATQDLVVRAQDQAPFQPGEVFMERGANVVANTALQGGLSGIAGTFNVLDDIATTGRVPSPLRLMRGPIQQEGVEAAARLEARTGLPMEMSIGQSTGNPLLATAEVYMEAKQAGAGPSRAARARREAQRTNIQDWMVDPATLPLDEEIGRRGIAVLTDVAETADTAVLAAKRQVETEGQTAIQDLLAQRFNLDVAPHPAVIAKRLRHSGIDLKGAWDDEVETRYGALWSHPKANVPNVPAKPVSDAAQEVLAVWPRDPVTGELVTKNAPDGLLAKVQEAVLFGGRNVTSPLLNAQGQAQTTFVAGFMPLRQLAGLRTFMDQNITGGQAITGIKEGKLIALRGAINTTIRNAAAKDPALKALYHHANDYYAENAPRFNNKLIDQLFKRPEHPGYIGDPEFLASLTESGSLYKRIQEFFGRSSDEMRLINREAADSLLRKSLRSSFGDELDAQALRNNMGALHSNKKTRDVFFGVFGKRADEIIFELDALEKVGALKGRNISARELATSLDSNAANRPSMRALLDSQRDTELLYSNNIVKRFVKGELSVEAIRSEEFVNWLAHADLQDAQEVMTMIRTQRPELAEQIGRKETQRFFREAARSATPSDILHEIKGGTGSMPSAAGMHKQLGNKDSQAKLEEVLGKPRYDLLRDYILVELTEAEKQRMAAGTGIMTKGGVIGALFRNGFNPSEVSDWAKTKALSYMINSPTLASWLGSGYKGSDMPDLARAIINSEPFLAAVADDLKGDSRAFELISSLRRAARFGQPTQPPSNPPSTPAIPEAEFRRRAGLPVQ